MNHFHANQRDFSILATSIASFLVNLQPSIVYSYNNDDQTFMCKQTRHGAVREDVISLYWDNECLDHIIEVRKVAGDCLFGLKMFDIFAALRQHLIGVVFAPSSSCRLPCFATNTTTFHTTPLMFERPALHERQAAFFSHLQTLCALAQNNAAENRREAARMICDLTQQQLIGNSDDVFFFQPQCVTLLMLALEHLVSDSFVEVFEVAILAVDTLVTHFPAYQQAFVQSLPIMKRVEFILRELQTSGDLYLYAYGHLAQASHRILQAMVYLCREAEAQQRLVDTAPVRLIRQLSFSACQSVR